MRGYKYFLVTGLTWYRIIAAPLLLVLIFTGQLQIFKWMLPVSFFSDLIDGPIARKLKVATTSGAKLDSIGDDITVFVAITGLFYFKIEFIKEEAAVFIFLFSLFIIQTASALIRYKRITSFHTYLAKAAAIFQGVFLILVFLLPEPVYFLFYLAAGITAIELIEETILVFLLPKWEINVKGLFWVLKRRTDKGL